MKFIYITVCYHNAEITLEAIKSFKSKTSNNSLVIVVDNSENYHTYNFLKKKIKLLKNVKILKSKKNLGYFKGLNKGLKFLHKKFKSMNSKIVLVGNNDIIFKNRIKNNYFKNINSEQYPVISPSISRPNGINLNPYKLKAYNYLRSLKINHFISKSFVFYYFWIILNNIKKNILNNKTKSLQSGEIFLGHGTLYILLPSFFKFFKYLPSKTFLLGEELFLTLMLLKKKKKIFFINKILIQTTSNISFGSSVINNKNYKKYKIFKNFTKNSLKILSGKL